MKKLIILISGILLIFACTFGATFAYLTDTDEANNVMTTGNISIKQIEQQRGADGKLEAFTHDKKIYPGVYLGYDENELPMDGDYFDSDEVYNSIDKIITVENTGRSSAYVRTVIAFEQGSFDGERFDELLIMNKNDADWSWKKVGNDIILNDGGVERKYSIYCVEYNSVLESGDVTAPNLKQILFSGSFEFDEVNTLDPDEDGEYTILVFTQAVQCEGFQNADEAFAASFGNVTADNNPWSEGI